MSEETPVTPETQKTQEAPAIAPAEATAPVASPAAEAAAPATEQVNAPSTSQEQDEMTPEPAKAIPPIMAMEEPKKEPPKIEIPKESKQETIAPRKTGLNQSI